MKRRNIDTMREVRLWIGQIVVPTLTVVGSALAIPEVRSVVSAKATELKQKIDKKIKKRRSPINGALSFILSKGDLI